MSSFEVQDFGNGPNLFLGGVFHGPGGNDHLAQWGGCRGCPALTTYCTAGVSTHGCAATLTGSGTPSASATAGFVVACSNIEGQRNGLLYYGTTDELNLPWNVGSTSYRCVAPPVQRLPSMVSGGTAGQCDGSYSVDVLAYWATHPGALGTPFSAGDEVWAQVWYRDPSAVTGTNLSDGLYWVFCP